MLVSAVRRVVLQRLRNRRRWGEIERHRTGRQSTRETLVHFALLLDRLLTVRLGERDRSRRVLRVDPDVEDPRLPSVAVIDSDRFRGILSPRKQDDSEPSTTSARDRSCQRRRFKGIPERKEPTRRSEKARRLP